jgi:hypothetical protein
MMTLSIKLSILYSSSLEKRDNSSIVIQMGTPGAKNIRQ